MFRPNTSPPSNEDKNGVFEYQIQPQAPQSRIYMYNSLLDKLTDSNQNNTNELDSLREATDDETDPLLSRSVNVNDHQRTQSTSHESVRFMQLQDENNHFGMFLLAVSGMFGACMALLVHLASTDGFGAVAIGWSRSVVQVVISGVLLLYQNDNPFEPAEYVNYFIARGMFGMGGVTCLYYGFAVLPLADATALYYTLPIPTAIFAWIFLGEPYGLPEVLAAVTGLVGVICITRPPMIWPLLQDITTVQSDSFRHTVSDVSLAHICCLCGAMLTSLAFITIRRVGRQASAMVLTFWHGIAGFVVCGVLMVLMNQTKVPQSWYQMSILLGVGVLALSVQFLVNKGLQLEAAGPGALMTNLQLVWAYLLQVAFQHKPIVAWCVFGSTLIVSASIGTFLYHNYKDRKRQAEIAATDTQICRRSLSTDLSAVTVEQIPEYTSTE
eukprot:CFRG4617T1